MHRRLTAGLVVLGLLAGCASLSESRLNPFNWFQRSEEVATLTPEDGFADTNDARPLIEQITALSIERTLDGAIVRATGLPPTQGYYDGELVSVSDREPVDGVLEFDFRAYPPLAPTPSGTRQSREVIVGLFLSAQDLAGVSQIRVNAASNARAARR